MTPLQRQTLDLSDEGLLAFFTGSECVCDEPIEGKEGDEVWEKASVNTQGFPILINQTVTH